MSDGFKHVRKTCTRASGINHPADGQYFQIHPQPLNKQKADKKDGNAMEANTRNVTIPSNHEYFLTADMTPVIIAADHVTSNAKNATKTNSRHISEAVTGRSPDISKKTQNLR